MIPKKLPITENKICGCCKHDKPVSAFRKRPDGSPQSYCNDCQRETQRKYQAKVRADKDLYFRYRQKINKSYRRYKLTRLLSGKPMYIPMSMRYDAIMKLV